VSRDLLRIAGVAHWGAICFFVLAAWIAVLKLGIIVFNYIWMRRSLRKYYSAPIEWREADFSNETWPTLLKFDKELEALGARRVCDLSFESSPGLRIGSCVYLSGDASVDLMLQNGGANFSSFPPIPLVTVSTRFRDGAGYYTVTTPVYRKWSRSIRAGQCLLDGEGIDEVLAAHRREIDKLVSAGAVPVAPENTASAVIELVGRTHEEGRELWQKSPYSWADAVRQAFEVCRKEFGSR
jgi:hypothetical protein